MHIIVLVTYKYLFHTWAPGEAQHVSKARTLYKEPEELYQPSRECSPSDNHVDDNAVEQDDATLSDNTPSPSKLK